MRAHGAAELARVTCHMAQRLPGGRPVAGLACEEVERDACIVRHGRQRRGARG